MEARYYTQYRFDVLKAHGGVAYLDTQGYIEHGVYNNPIYSSCFSYVNAYECFASGDLCCYCAIVIPTDIDEVLLYKYRSKISEYLNKGGILLSFAQVFLPWLPGNSLCQSLVYETGHEICTCPHSITSGVRDHDLNYVLGVKLEINRTYFIPPPKSMCFLSDNSGLCMGYIDENTTNGVIVATAGIDLFNFFIYEFSTSRRLGLNLLMWLEEFLSRKRVA